MTDHPFTPIPGKPTKCRWCMLAQGAHPCPECDGEGGFTTRAGERVICPECLGKGKQT